MYSIKRGILDLTEFTTPAKLVTAVAEVIKNPTILLQVNGIKFHENFYDPEADKAKESLYQMLRSVRFEKIAENDPTYLVADLRVPTGEVCFLSPFEARELIAALSKNTHLRVLKVEGMHGDQLKEFAETIAAHNSLRYFYFDSGYLGAYFPQFMQIIYHNPALEWIEMVSKNIIKPAHAFYQPSKEVLEANKVYKQWLKVKEEKIHEEVAKCTTKAELFRLFDKMEFLPHPAKNDFVSAASHKMNVEDFFSGKKDESFITRSFGLRDKVKELMQATCSPTLSY